MKTEDDDGVVCEGFEIPGYGGPRAGRVATWEQRETMSVHKIWSINCLRGTITWHKTFSFLELARFGSGKLGHQLVEELETIS